MYADTLVLSLRGCCVLVSPLFRKPAALFASVFSCAIKKKSHPKRVCHVVRSVTGKGGGGDFAGWLLDKVNVKGQRSAMQD